MKHKVGKLIVPDEAKKELSNHEIKSFEALRDNGYVVEIIVASKLYKVRSADVLVNSAVWEIKSPNNNNNIEKALRKAKQQCDRIIIDTRRTKLTEDFIVKRLLKELKLRKKLKFAKIINKNGKVIDI